MTKSHALNCFWHFHADLTAQHPTHHRHHYHCQHKNQEKFLIYRDFAYYYSPVFDVALNGRFIESENLNIAIDDFDFPNVFGLAMGWMYT
jgi:hypothetical protein